MAGCVVRDAIGVYRIWSFWCYLLPLNGKGLETRIDAMTTKFIFDL